MKKSIENKARRHGGTEARRAGSRRRAFTLVELLVAGLITALVLGTVAFSLAQVGRARAMGKARMDAFMRAEAALDSIRRDVASTIRSDDLFQCRVLLIDDVANSPDGALDRDELLLFTDRLQPIHPIDYSGEGVEYETQFRVADDNLGSALWERRDAAPDHTPGGGGMVAPIADGVLALSIEAYDGDTWYGEWDSDVYGLPRAIRVTVTTCGARNGADAFAEDVPRAVLRTLIPIDRVLTPADVVAAAVAEADAAAAEAAGEGEPEKGVTDLGVQGEGGGGVPVPGAPGAGGGAGGGGAGGPPGGPPGGGGGGGGGPRGGGGGGNLHHGGGGSHGGGGGSHGGGGIPSGITR